MQGQQGGAGIAYAHVAYAHVAYAHVVAAHVAQRLRALFDIAVFPQCLNITGVGADPVPVGILLRQPVPARAQHAFDQRAQGTLRGAQVQHARQQARRQAAAVGVGQAQPFGAHLRIFIEQQQRQCLFGLRRAGPQGIAVAGRRYRRGRPGAVGLVAGALPQGVRGQREPQVFLLRGGVRAGTAAYAVAQGQRQVLVETGGGARGTDLQGLMDFYRERGTHATVSLSK
ncbi:hypothetical protein F2P46_07460 [Massilia sp. CCM 8734]|nr:hypothetical protein [Massilia sp. CCM 8734]